MAKRDAWDGARADPPKPGAMAGEIDLGVRRQTLEPSAREMVARIELRRPLVIVHLSTTGALRQHDRVVAVFAVKLWPSGDTLLRFDTVNPMRPISPEATAVHGITDEDVARSPAFPAIAAGWAALLADCDIAGVDSEGRDVALLEAEYVRADIDLPLTDHRVDAHRLLPDRDRRALQSAIRFGRGRTAECAGRDARGRDATVTPEHVHPERDYSGRSLYVGMESDPPMSGRGAGALIPAARSHDCALCAECACVAGRSPALPGAHVPAGAGDAPTRRCTLGETSPTGPLPQKSRAWISRPLCSFCGIG